jgi:hypothetical protein
LNTGSAGVVQQEVKPLTKVAHTDTLYDATKGWAAAPGALISIVSRAPAHSPWSSANQGVDVKVDNNASANFPSEPSAAVAATNSQVPSTPNAPVAPSVASTVPVTGPISAALDKNTTTAMIGQVATMAQTGPAAAAVKLGAGVVNGVAVIGKMAQSPQQLEAAGVIKSGSATLVNALVSSGKTIEQSMPSSIFTGKPGAENIATYINNSTAQVKAQVSNFQQAQTQLTQAGVITGKEAPGQIAGLVTATASVGLASTVNYLKTAAGALGAGGVSGLVNKAGGAVNTMLGSVTGAISSGNFAANLSSVVTGGLGSIATSLGGLTKLGGGLSGLLDSAKGVAGSAFAAITKGFPTLKSGVPQNLKQIADKAIADVQSSGTEASDAAGVLKSAAANSGIDAASIASGAASSATNGLASVTKAVTTGLGASTNLASVAQNAVSAIKATLPASASTGLGGLPGAQSAVATIIDNAKGAVNLIPGASTITGAISQITSSISTGTLPGGAANLINKLKVPGASLQALASIGLSPALSAKLNSSISSLSSGGAIPITLPIVGINTNDRTSLTTQLTNVFGSSKIPVPNYSGNPATTGETAGTAALDKANERLDKINGLSLQIKTELAKLETARIAYAKAQQELPAGDTAIETAAEEIRAIKRVIIDLQDQISKL